MVKNETILVIGKNSFIGSCFLNYATNHFSSVRGIGSSECDFLDRGAVLQLFKSLGSHPHVVLFPAVINKSVENSRQSFEKNLRMVENLIDGCAAANITKLLYFSSVDVFGNGPVLPITESSPLEPDTWYGLAKYCSEWSLRHAADLKIPALILRVPGVFGRHPRDPSVVGKIFHSARSSGRIFIQGSGAVKRDYLFVGDLCRILERLIRVPVSGTINLVTGVSVSIQTLAEEIQQILGSEITIEHTEARVDREFDLVFDNSALIAQIGPFDFTELQMALRSYL